MVYHTQNVTKVTTFFFWDNASFLNSLFPKKQSKSIN